MGHLRVSRIFLRNLGGGRRPRNFAKYTCLSAKCTSDLRLSCMSEELNAVLAARRTLGRAPSHRPQTPHVLSLIHTRTHSARGWRLAAGAPTRPYGPMSHAHDLASPRGRGVGEWTAVVFILLYIAQPAHERAQASSREKFRGPPKLSRNLGERPRNFCTKLSRF